MRVLLVNDYGTIHGGAEISTVMLRDGLRRRGHVSMLFRSLARQLDLPRVADVECYGTVSRYRTLLQTAKPSAWRGLRRVLAQYRPDIVHVRMFLMQLSPLILPLLRQMPSIYPSVGCVRSARPERRFCRTARPAASPSASPAIDPAACR
jgi:hypothetical protein